MSPRNVTHKSFSFVVLPSTASHILYSSSMFPCPMCIYLHFPKLNNICRFSDHLTHLSRSSCKLCFICIICNVYVIPYYSPGDTQQCEALPGRHLVVGQAPGEVLSNVKDFRGDIQLWARHPGRHSVVGETPGRHSAVR